MQKPQFKTLIKFINREKKPNSLNNKYITKNTENHRSSKTGADRLNKNAPFHTRTHIIVTDSEKPTVYLTVA